MGYQLTLTAEDVETIAFVGGRYEWSDVLCKYDEGTNEIPEHEAWAIDEAFAADTEGAHAMFPMLDPRSDLYEKLSDFHDSIV